MYNENGRGSLVAKKTRENANGENSHDRIAYSCLLKNELLRASIEDIERHQSEERRVLLLLVSKNLFKYTTPTEDRTLSRFWRLRSYKMTSI